MNGKANYVLFLLIFMLIFTTQTLSEAADLKAEPNENLIPDDWTGVPYNPWEKLQEISQSDALPNDEFYFIVIGDSQTAGDRRKIEVFKRTLNWILNNLNPRPVMIFETGDLSAGHGGGIGHWQGFHEAITYNDFWNKVAYIPVIGDHDSGSEEYGYPTSYGGSPYQSGAMFHEMFHIPSEHQNFNNPLGGIRSSVALADPKYNYVNERYWAFEYKNSLFVSMDVKGKDGLRGGPLYGDTYPSGGKQKAWMEDVMANSGAQHIFFFSHRGFKANFGDDMRSALEEYKATAYFSGHWHIYGRGQLEGESYTHYVNSATAGGTSADYSPDGFPSSGLKTNVIGFTLVHIKGDTATTYYYSMDYPDNVINGIKSIDEYQYSTSKFRGMDQQAQTFMNGGPELIGWIMDTNVMTSARVVGPPDDTPPSIPQNLQATADSESRIDLTWDVSTDNESSVSKYNIYRNNVDVGDSISTTFSDTGLNEDTQYTYQVSAVSAGGESNKSISDQATTLADTIPPTIISVSATSSTSVKVVFSEKINNTDAETNSNYQINNINVLSASLGEDLKTVTLTTSSHTAGVTYTVTVNNIKDRATNQNTIVANTMKTYNYIHQLIITNLAVTSGNTYEVVQDGLQVGAPVYNDRSYTFISISSLIQGSSYIKTANDDKGLTDSSFLTFDVNQDVIVYVAHDDKITTNPSWLSSFTDTGDNIVTSDTTLSLFSKNFSTGTITLGGNEGGGKSMYSVIVDLQGLSVHECNDKIDNDGDGLVDYPADPGCQSSTDNDESNSTSDTTPPSPPTELRRAIQ